MTRVAPPRRIVLRPNERNYGVIVTAVHDDGPPLWTFHVPGGATEALRAACAMIEARGAGWKIRTVSTPVSVMTDLQGTRAQRRDVPGYGGPGSNDDIRPERIQLGKIGRLDLLEAAA